MDKLNFTTNQLILGGALFIAILSGGGLWYAKGAEKTRLYVEAAADCQNGRGDGKLRALDRIYGDDARPKKLSFDLASCALDASIDRLRKAQRLRSLLSD